MNNGDIVVANCKITANVSDEGEPLVMAHAGDKLKIINKGLNDSYEVVHVNDALHCSFYVFRHQLRG